MSATSRGRLHGAVVSVFALVSALAPRAPCAEPTTPGLARERAAAADAFDRGVRAYDQRTYAIAARAFLEADSLAASQDAITNAFTAAERAGDRALLEQVRIRALEREPAEPELAARIALLLAETPPPGPAEEARAPSLAEPPPKPTRPVPEPERVTHRAAVAAHAPESKGGWSPEVVYVGAGATLALAGVTVWSSLDTLAARNRLPGTRSENDNVWARAHRTDALLAGTVLLAGATAYVGLRLVDWHGPQAQAVVVASTDGHGAALTARGAF